MTRKILIPCFILMTAGAASATGYANQKPLKLNAEAMLPTLTAPHTYKAYTPAPTARPSLPDINDNATNDNATNVKQRYTFMGDQTWAGIPLLLAGIAADREGKAFRNESGIRLETNFHTEADDYMRFVPHLGAAVLNVAGVEGRSDLKRFLAGSAMSYAIMAAISYPLKHAVGRVRPDGSTDDSWPSGHTATAFVGATILHKEYGLTRSPWYSVAGYGIATATGVMRVLNNRHWAGDVLSGAGIGILSAELAYGLSDILFKDTHLKRGEAAATHDCPEGNPSFFSISAGVGLGAQRLDFGTGGLCLQLQASTAVGIEGAYFFNRYIGTGGRLRIRTTPVKDWDFFRADANKHTARFTERVLTNYVDLHAVPGIDFTFKSDRMTEYTGDAGLYLQLPLGSRLALGSKLLIGCNWMQDTDLNALMAGKVAETTGYATGSEGGVAPISKDNTKTEYMAYYAFENRTTIKAKNSLKYGTGLSLMYAHKKHFAWKVFADYDFTRKNYTMEYDFGEKSILLTEGVNAEMFKFSNTNNNITRKTTEKKKNMHTWVVGGSLAVLF